jgi:hypothetical protein
VKLDLHVVSASVKETEVAGECYSEIVIAGTSLPKAHELIAMLGEDVVISTSDRSAHATLFAVAVKLDKGKADVKAKASGGRDLDRLVGLAVDIAAAQARIA